ncbi:MAG: HDIG domain-containing protein [Spirochaetia bacterium]|jgi:putative nucleotidyltransferase with HDIG domain|nr:HDIG domain-containing protein [Spirochaetia bacterium]
MKTNETKVSRVWRLILASLRRNRVFAIHMGVCIFAAALLLVFLGPGSVAIRRDYSGIEPGDIADRDIMAGREVVYIDEEATALRRDAEERLVLPVFQFDSGISKRALDSFKDFADNFRALSSQDIAQETALLMLQSKFPGKLSPQVLADLAKSSLKSQVLVYAEDILGAVLDGGVFSLPTEGLSRYNQDYFELKRLINNKAELEQRSMASMVTRSDLPEAVRTEAERRHLARPISSLVESIVLGFVAENSFFDEASSLSRIKRVGAKVEPVFRAVGRNELLIRKGEIVTEESYAKLVAVRSAVSRSDFGLSLRSLGLLLAAACLGYFLLRQREGTRPFNLPSLLMGLYSALAFYAVVLLASRSGQNQASLEGAYFLPIALFSGIGAAIFGQRFALSYTVVLAMLSASASNLNAYWMVFVILAGFFAAMTISTAKTRLDLVLACVLQAAIQFGLSVILLLQQGLRFQQLAGISGYMAMNGFISGALILAILPVLEQSLNLATRFRLLELSDVNAPALKELLTQAPGTYAHSMNVAHLAEAAAEDIGANALLARVGAYYHDLGKIEQPEYFVENQRGSNKHDDINPRLSATVIRSHVKLGTEKARELKLPKEVVDIVAQHHGNSVIAWFYDKAKKEDETIRPEDFSYPGSPPVNKEAGIVMLADSIEASSRTIKNPTVPRLDAHIREMIMHKVQNGQLDNCELTMKDLEMIRHSFVRIMAGQFHSRIEYPNQKEKDQ